MVREGSLSLDEAETAEPDDRSTIKTSLDGEASQKICFVVQWIPERMVNYGIHYRRTGNAYLVRP